MYRIPNSAVLVWSCSVARQVRQELRTIHDMNVSFYTLGTVLEKPRLSQLFKKFSNLYRTRDLITKIKQPALMSHPDLHLRTRNATSHNSLISSLMLSPRQVFLQISRLKFRVYLLSPQSLLHTLSTSPLILRKVRLILNCIVKNDVKYNKLH